MISRELVHAVSKVTTQTQKEKPSQGNQTKKWVLKKYVADKNDTLSVGFLGH